MKGSGMLTQVSYYIVSVKLNKKTLYVGTFILFTQEYPIEF